MTNDIGTGWNNSQQSTAFVVVTTLMLLAVFLTAVLMTVAYGVWGLLIGGITLINCILLIWHCFGSIVERRTASQPETGYALKPQIAQQLSSSLDPDVVIVNLLRAARQMTEAETATIALLIDSDALWTLTRSNSDDSIHRFHRSRQEDGTETDRIYQQVILTRAEVSNPCGFFVPLLHDNLVIGVLSVERSGKPFSPEQKFSLTRLARHAVISINDSRLFEDSRYEVKTLSGLQALALRLSSVPNFNTAADAIVDTARGLLNAEHSLLMIYDADNDRITRYRRQTATTPDPQVSSVFQPEDVLSTARKGDLVVLQRDNRGMIFAPVKRAGRVREVICVARPGEFRKRELNAITLLAVQAAGHFENAMLNERIRTGSDWLQAVVSSARDGILITDLNGSLVHCNTAAERMLGIERERVVGQPLAMMLLRLADAGELGDSETGYTRQQIRMLARDLRLEPERITRRQFSRVHGEYTIYIEEIGSPIVDEDGRITGRLLVMRD
ncbi:MAG: PAS domain-containing protein [Blastochloris sp.]|nr:PAS domain-containing protein [Blastochloris sp.]